MSLVFNIGLQVGTIEPHGQLVRSIKFLAELFEPSSLRTEIRQSTTERTLVVELDSSVCDLTNRVHTLCLALHQDAIAWTANGHGFLTGPKAADWGGEFNPEFFLVPSWSK